MLGARNTTHERHRMLASAPWRRALPPGHIRPDSTSTSSTAGEPCALSPTAWALAIRSAARLGRYTRALSLYARMHGSGLRSDPFTICAALKACARIHSRPCASALHAHALKYGHHRHLYPATALISLYSKLATLEYARRLFDEMPVRNVISWNSMISAYLRAGDMEAARRMFDEMPVKDVVSWNSLVAGYAQAGLMDESLDLFRGMPERNSASWNGIMSAHIGNGDMEKAREMFDRMPWRSNVSWVAMISGYSRCGDLTSARELFDRMDERDVFSWNAMISGYAQNDHPREALHLFNRMRKPEVDVAPDEMTFSSAISACSQLSDLRYGLWVESHMSSVGVEMDDHLRTALIDLYAKCGSIDKAFKLFDDLRRRDLVSYSAMILGCGINGKPNDAVVLFDEMLLAKTAPNAVTFVGLLTAYKHAGLVEEARRCFSRMQSEHGVTPSVDHYAIMVEILGRSGSLEEAYRLIKEMPMKAHAGVWGALLLACRLHGHVELGEIAARSCVELDPEASGYEVLLAHIYAEAGEWDRAKRLRKEMVRRGLSKIPGCSWVQPR